MTSVATNADPSACRASGLRILLAEDNPALGQALEYCLRKRGHAVDLATDGEAALRLLAQGGTQLLVLDLGLPKVDGATVLMQARQRNPRLPVLVSSARDDAEARLAEHGLRADACLAKPFSIAEFERVLLQLAWRSGLADREVEGLGLGEDERRVYALLSARSDQWLDAPEIACRLGEAGSAMAPREVELCIEALRDKLAAHSPVRLVKVRGLGYGLVATG